MIYKKLLEEMKSGLEKDLERTRRQLNSLLAEDPFADSGRVIDNAASDTDAMEEAGHDRIEALRKELEYKLANIERALKRIDKGIYGKCKKCGKKIEVMRLKIMPTAFLCVQCEKEREGVK